MGVDYYSCDVCGEALYEEYVDNCANCDRNLCVDCLDVDDKRIDGSYTSPYVLCNEVEDMTDEEKENFLRPLYEKYGQETVDEWVSYGGINPSYCPYCNGSQVDNEDLLQYLLTKYNLKYDDVVEEYKTSK
jgi:hypothetical protein